MIDNAEAMRIFKHAFPGFRGRKIAVSTRPAGKTISSMASYWDSGHKTEWAVVQLLSHGRLGEVRRVPENGSGFTRYDRGEPKWWENQFPTVDYAVAELSQSGSKAYAYLIISEPAAAQQA